MAGKTEYKNKWQSENCDRINLTVKKGAKAQLQEAARKKGESINGYIKNAVKAQYSKDGDGEIDL